MQSTELQPLIKVLSIVSPLPACPAFSESNLLRAETCLLLDLNHSPLPTTSCHLLSPQRQAYGTVRAGAKPPVSQRCLCPTAQGSPHQAHKQPLQQQVSWQPVLVSPSEEHALKQNHRAGRRGTRGAH